MDKSKVRIRSKEELKSREEGFLEIVDILQKNNIFFLYKLEQSLEQEEKIIL